MSLTKVTYVDDETIIGAQNLNDIQDSIVTMENTIEIDSTNVTVHKPLFCEGRSSLSSTDNLDDISIYAVGTHWCDDVQGKPSDTGTYGWVVLMPRFQSYYPYSSEGGAHAYALYIRGYTNNAWGAWQKISTDERYEIYTFKTAITAGTIGTRGAQMTYNPSYTVRSVEIYRVQNSTQYIPVTFFNYNSNTVYCNWYRATTTATSESESEIQVKIYKA